MEKKKHVGGIILVVILFLTIIGLIGYILIDKDVIKLKKEEKEVSEKKEIEENISEEELHTLLEKFYLVVDENKRKEDGRRYFPKQMTIYNTNYNDSVKLSVAWNNLSGVNFKQESCSELYSSDLLDKGGRYKTDNGVCPQEKGVDTIPYKDFNNVYKSMFGSDVSKKGVSNYDNLDYYFIDYLEDKDLFVELECGGCGGTTGPYIYINKLKSYEVKDNKLIVDLYYSFMNMNNLSFQNNIYTFKLGEHTITKEAEEGLEVPVEKIQQEIEENYMDEIDVYQATFEKEGSNYIFNSLEKK